jgi:mRNA interferase HigB
MGGWNQPSEEAHVLIKNKRAIKQFTQTEPKASPPLIHWAETVETANWHTPADVLKTFNQTDCVNSKWIFNIGGNNYRLAALIWFKNQTVFILKIMTHKEYNREIW